jgi:hypothetical protein
MVAYPNRMHVDRQGTGINSRRFKGKRVSTGAPNRQPS